jgi:hypothetical protein
VPRPAGADGKVQQVPQPKQAKVPRREPGAGAIIGTDGKIYTEVARNVHANDLSARRRDAGLTGGGKFPAQGSTGAATTNNALVSHGSFEELVFHKSNGTWGKPADGGAIQLLEGAARGIAGGKGRRSGLKLQADPRLVADLNSALDNQRQARLHNWSQTVMGTEYDISASGCDAGGATVQFVVATDHSGFCPSNADGTMAVSTCWRQLRNQSDCNRFVAIVAAKGNNFHAREGQLMGVMRVDARVPQEVYQRLAVAAGRQDGVYSVQAAPAAVLRSSTPSSDQASGESWRAWAGDVGGAAPDMCPRLCKRKCL